AMADDLPTAVDAADDTIGRNVDVVEEHRAVGARLDAELGDRLHAHALRLPIDDESRNALPGWSIRVRPRRDEHVVSDVGAGNEDLLPIDAKSITVAPGRRPDRGGVAAGVGLRIGDRELR